MIQKKEILLLSKNNKIRKDLKVILKKYYKINWITNDYYNYHNSIILFDLTEHKISKIKKNKPYDFSLKNIKKLKDNNLIPIAIINKSQKKYAAKILKLNFEDFIIYPFFDIKLYSTINNILRNVDYVEELNKLYQIGIELSAETNLDKLLEKILTTCREITMADGGSIYIVLPGIDPVLKVKMLSFEYSQNDTLGNIYQKFTIPINKNSISGYVASEKKTLNIKDCYKIPENAKYKFFSNFDKANNYITKSMMTVPMINHVNEVIGVVQLINRKKKKDIKLDSKNKADKYVIDFDPKCERLIHSLSSQAAVCLENTMLYKELRNIFDSFIEASALAVESRDPTTAGHSRRVSIYSVAMAREINKSKKPAFININFSDEDLLAIRYAALLHDFGKIGVSEYVLTKSEKLMLSEFENIKERFETIKYHIGAHIKNKDDKEKELIKVDKYFELLEKAKLPGKLTIKEKNTLKKLAELKYITIDGKVKPYLTNEELKSYLIENGSLTDNERNLIRSHVFHSFKFLDEIPWPADLKNIPKIAYAHHEMMDGSGYPNKLKAKDIPLESQILCVADVFDALIAEDRPYKKKVDIEETLKILKDKAKEGKLNKDIVELFIDTKIHEKYNL